MGFQLFLKRSRAHMFLRHMSGEWHLGNSPGGRIAKAGRRGGAHTRHSAGVVCSGRVFLCFAVFQWFQDRGSDVKALCVFGSGGVGDHVSGLVSAL